MNTLSATLQGGYLILITRALGLDTGSMSGFDRAKIGEAFSAGTSRTANFPANFGHGDPAGSFARSPRLTFDEACRIV